ncbi:hypothetical protein H8959_010669 [Pygathrix nigripes]
MFEDESHAEGAAVVAAAGEALQALCQELNLDEGSAAEALDDFTAIRGNYSLEGEVTHWLACSLYVACRKSIIPTVGKGIMEGNCVSLTRILRSAKLSLIQFFSKMKKWMDMSNLPQEFRERIERLERNFEVSTVIFKKYEPIFLDIFQNPYEEPPKLPRSRKQRRIPCSVKDLFNFCWTLFVYTKGKMTLSVVLHFYCGNLVLFDMRGFWFLCLFFFFPPYKGNFRMIGDDLVNSYHLLLCCLDLIFANAIMCPNRQDLLNPSFKGLPSDFHTADFRASEEPPCIIAVLCELHDGLLVEAKGIKEHYFKPYISKLFDRKILKGECLLDLSSFTDNSKAVNKEYEEYVLTVGDFDERIFLGADAEEEIGTPRKFTGDTPLGKLTAQANVEYNLQQHFEKKRSFAPSTPLTGQRYLREKEAVITPVASATQSVSRLQSIVAGLKNAPSDQLTNIFEYVLLEQDIFHHSLMACCLEIVLFAYSSPRTFPWIIEVLNLQPFYFYKVIEVVIRSEEGLSRDMVKHLNSIEEQILESLAWRNGGNVQGHLPMMPMSPLMHPRVKEVRTDSGSLRRDMQPLSPISVHERYSSPTAGSAKRRLFGEDPPKEMLMGKIITEGTKLKIAPSSSITAENISILPGQTLLTMATAPLTGTTGHKVMIPSHGVANDAAEIKLIPVSMNTNQESKVKSPVSLTAHSLIGTSPKQTSLTKAQEVHSTGISRPKRTGSLALFYRKIFITKHDCSVTKEERTFQEIMKSYRNQPQANSHVYRSVLLKSIPREFVAYNKNINDDFEMIDCGRVKSFALKYDLSNQDHVMDAPPLSPFPHIKQQPGSPRRISQQHSIYISPHKNGSGLTPRSALLYKFNGSPSKSLKEINNMIRQGEQRTKKRVIAIDSDAESPAKRVCQENDDVLLKRLQDVVSERANH